MQDQDYINEIADKWIAGTITEEEKRVFDKWYNTFNFSEYELQDSVYADEAALREAIRKRIKNHIPEFRHPAKPLGLRITWKTVSIAAAASVILIAGIWFSINWNSTSNYALENTSVYVNDIKPGRNTAVLTFANGRKINLSNAKSEVIVDADNIKYNDGSLVDTASQTTTASSRTEGRDLSSGGNNPSHSLGIASVSTPRGGSYKVILPDGTKVWLNAASSIKFHSSFAGLKQRRVNITGEVYFEVAKDKLHPFIVESERQVVEVLGTHFNINAYKNEDVVKTTLVEGSLRVSYNGNDVLLKPNQQTANSQDGIKVVSVDTESEIAWKNGKFVFEKESIQSIMRKLERWYDVDVVYEEDFANIKFTGSISRGANISKILNKITYTQAVNFKIEGRRVTVIP